LRCITGGKHFIPWWYEESWASELFSETHCHLTRLSQEALRRAIAQAEKSAIELVLNAGSDPESSKLAIQNAREHQIIKACVGLHPWNAGRYSDEMLEKLKELVRHPEVVAVSEIGLDYVGRMNSEGKFVNEFADKEIQRNAFREQLRIAKNSSLPVIVHDRTPEQEVLDILEEEGNLATGVAIHGFSKDSIYAKKCVDMGIYLSIGLRTISSQENEAFKETVKQIPLPSLLTETDSQNPEGVLIVAKKIAELKGLSIDDVGLATTQNLRKLIRQHAH
jgi:TatD DNase family protein